MLPKTLSRQYIFPGKIKLLLSYSYTVKNKSF